MLPLESQRRALSHRSYANIQVARRQEACYEVSSARRLRTERDSTQTWIQATLRSEHSDWVPYALLR